MKKIYILILSFMVLGIVACSNNSYIIGGNVQKSNKVNVTTFQFLQQDSVITETADLIKRAGLVNLVNGNVTFIAPSNFAVDRYLRRRNNRMLRLNPDTTLLTLNHISIDTLQQLKMYVVKGKWTRNTIPKDGIKLATLEQGDSLRLFLQKSNSEPAAAWDGAGVSGWGYQYTNWMQSDPLKVFVEFKRGEYWEETGQQRAALGFNNPETDKVYQMYLSDIETTTGVIQIPYVGNYNYQAHTYYPTLFFYGTTADDKL